MKINRLLGRGAIVALAIGVLCADGAQARARRSRGGSRSFEAESRLKRAQNYLSMREYERGIEILKSVIQQYPAADVRFKAMLALGRHFIEVRKQNDAIGYLKQIRAMEKPGRVLRGDNLNVFLESLYLTGVAHFELRQYSAAFPVLRKITGGHPDTVWANQAYYYIGKCHFVQKNWNKAIQALQLVGTFIDPDVPGVEFMEAGRRFYVKIADGDLPVLNRLGRKVTVQVTTSAGDRETVKCAPLTTKADVFIGSIATAIGEAKKADGTLQVLAGQTVTTRYVDDNTQAGEKDVLREARVQVVSTGAVEFKLGDLETKAAVAFIGQPQFVMLHDADLDTSSSRDTIGLRIVSRFKKSEDELAASPESEGVDVEKLFAEETEDDKYEIRDSVTLDLTELGTEPSARTGRFVGRVLLVPYTEDRPVNRNDKVLSCTTNDEIMVSYVDELHIGGRVPREVVAKLKVVGEIRNKPIVRVPVVPDPIIRAKKHIVESRAYLELARIFRDMGLKEGAGQRCDAGLKLVDSIVYSRTAYPSILKEKAFKQKWELEIVKEDYASAIQTCKIFSKAYPQSPFVDQALMGIGRIRTEKKQFKEAIGVFNEILRLPNSLSKAEAQWRIAQTVERQAERNALQKAKKGEADPAKAKAAAIAASIPHYKRVADRYPDSEFAGPSLAKLIDYHISTRDFQQADDLLEQVFQDHPDADFLDQMLLKWTLVAYRRGNYEKAHQKCRRLISEYPSSKFATKAKEILPVIERKVGGNKNDE